MSVRTTMLPPNLSTLRRPGPPSSFHHHNLPLYQQHTQLYRPRQPAMAYNSDNNTFLFQDLASEDGFGTPTFSAGTPNFDTYLPNPDASVLAQWRKSPMPAPIQPGQFRPYHADASNYNGSFGALTGAGDTEVQKVESNPMPNYTVSGSFSGSDTGSAGSVSSFKINDSPVQSVTRHPAYPTNPTGAHGAGPSEVFMPANNSPLEAAHHHTAYPAARSFPLQIDTSLDTSQYQPVNNFDWYFKVAADQEAHSPSTVDTPEDGPATPVNHDSFSMGLQGGSFAEPSATLPHSSKVESSDGMQQMSDFTRFPHLFYPASYQDLGAVNEPSSAAWGQSATTFTTRDDFVAQAGDLNLPMSNARVEARLDAPPNALRSSRFTAPGAYDALDRAAAMDTTPEPSDGTDEETESEPDINDQAVIEASHRRDRDHYLLHMRKKGYSYKEIKRRGRFREAESTLRGRVRVLTKHKSERVRKPEWTDNDVELLRDAVQRYEDEGDEDGSYHRSRIPWKRISQWMKQKGSTYTFAPATCAKKWKDLD